jgi:hypothetical protein
MSFAWTNRGAVPQVAQTIELRPKTLILASLADEDKRQRSRKVAKTSSKGRMHFMFTFDKNQTHSFSTFILELGSAE